MQIKLSIPKLFRESPDRPDSEILSFITDKRLIIAITLLSILAWIFYYNQGLTLTYNDARSHLNVARRMVDNLQPGFAQIGSVWLPLYHILILPFISNDFLWRTGLGGSIISMASFVLGGYYLLKTGDELKFDKRAKTITFLLYALNPNLLFMQATTMTESLLLFLAIAAVYYLIRWARYFKFVDLIYSGIFVFLSTLSRYDGWFLLLFVGAAVFFISLKKKGFNYAQGVSILLLTLAGFGVFLWFGWNLLIFGDPLYFATGPFSAKSQQDILFDRGMLLTKHDIIFSTFIYILTTVVTVGNIVSILSFIGLIIFISSKKLSWPVKMAVGILGVPYVFNIASLYIGHSVLHLPNIAPYNWFNVRYGLMSLPLIAVLLGFLVKGKNYIFYALLAIILSQSFQMYAANDIITIQDGVRGLSTNPLEEVTVWMHGNMTDGQLVMASSSSLDPLIFNSGLQLKQFISEGARIYWDDSIVDPSKHAGWVIFHKGDPLNKKLKDNEIFLTNFKLMYTDNYFYIYKKQTGWGRLDKSDLPE